MFDLKCEQNLGEKLDHIDMDVRAAIPQLEPYCLLIRNNTDVILRSATETYIQGAMRW